MAKIPLCKICYDYRDDIPFRIYVLMTQDWDSMKVWEKLKHGRKAKKLGSYKCKYLYNLYEDIKNTPVANTGLSWRGIQVAPTEFAWKGTPKEGQILRPMHFVQDHKSGFYYPSGGGSRVAIAYVLGHKYVPSFPVISTKEAVAWKKEFGIGSRHFDGMSDFIINKLLFRREINNELMRGIVAGECPDNFLFEIPDLGFRGKWKRDSLLFNQEFMSHIKGKKVLNLIQDNGYMEEGMSVHCEYIFTLAPCKYLRSISDKICKYYKTKNIEIKEQLNNGYDYNIILTTKISDFVRQYIKEGFDVLYNRDHITLIGHK